MHKKEDGKMSEVSEYAEYAYEILLATISSSSFHSHAIPQTLKYATNADTKKKFYASSLV